MEHLETAAVLILSLGGAWFCSRRKGYNPWIWFLGGTLNLLVLAFLPFTNKNATPTERDQRNQLLGNRIGFAVTMLVAGFNAALLWNLR